MSRLRRHLGLGEEIEINGEKFLIKPLTLESLPDIYKLISVFMSEDKNAAKAFANLDATILQRLIRKTLEASFPSEPQIDRDEWGMKYSFQLFEAIIKVNLTGVDMDDAKQQFHERQRRRQAELVPEATGDNSEEKTQGV